MRDNWLGNRVFRSYADILDYCCHAWNTLIDRPWRIISIGLRAWAHGFWSMRIGINRHKILNVATYHRPVVAFLLFTGAPR